MSSREKILSAIKKNQPAGAALPDLTSIISVIENPVERFKTVLTNIGGTIVEINTITEIQDYIIQNFSQSKRVVSTIPQLSSLENINDFKADPHLLENVDLAILQGHFGVAENAAIWITDGRMGDRALPFITQHLALVITKSEIVPTLHEAYKKIEGTRYELGTFIAGPSKTADIEQSLVLGAHGPKSMVVFLVR